MTRHESAVCTICWQGGGTIRRYRNSGYHTKVIIGYDHVQCVQNGRLGIHAAFMARAEEAWQKVTPEVRALLSTGSGTTNATTVPVQLPLWTPKPPQSPAPNRSRTD